MSPDWMDPDRLGAAGAGHATPHDVATRMLSFSQARLAAFASFDLDIGDIAWNLMLALFVAQERGQRLSVRALCDTLDLPRTVSVRWLRALRAGGLVDYDDRLEGLSAQARLTPAADSALRGLIGG